MEKYMNPETAKRLRASADGRELVEFVTKTILALDSVEGVDVSNDVAVEVRARQHAIKQLKSVLHPLVTVQDFERDVIDKREYSVDVV